MFLKSLTLFSTIVFTSGFVKSNILEVFGLKVLWKLNYCYLQLLQVGMVSLEKFLIPFVFQFQELFQDNRRFSNSPLKLIFTTVQMRLAITNGTFLKQCFGWLVEDMEDMEVRKTSLCISMFVILWGRVIKYIRIKYGNDVILEDE